MEGTRRREAELEGAPADEVFLETAMTAGFWGQTHTVIEVCVLTSNRLVANTTESSKVSELLPHNPRQRATTAYCCTIYDKTKQLLQQ